MNLNTGYIYKSGPGTLIPFNEQDNPDDLERILSVADKDGNTPLHKYNTCLPLLPQLENLKCLPRLLLKENKDGNTPLHDPFVCKLLFPLIQDMPQETFLTYFSKRNKEGRTPLHNAEICEIFLPVIQRIWVSPFQFLSIQDNEGKTPLHFENTCKILLPVLEPLDGRTLDILIRLFSIKNIYGTIPTTSVALEVLLPLLEKKEDHALIALLSIQDGDGYTPLHLPLCCQTLLPLLKKRDPKIQTKLLSLYNSELNTPLHLKYPCLALMPLLEEMEPARLAPIFGISNNENKKPFQLEEMCSILLPLMVKKTSISAAAHFLTSCDRDGDTVLHTYIWKSLIPFLKQMEIDDFVELFSTQNKDGHTPLHMLIKEQFELLFDQRTPSDLVKIFSIRDRRGNTVLHYNDTLQNCTHFLKKLPFSTLAMLFCIVNEKGITPSKNDLLFLETMDANNVVEALIATDCEWGEHELIPLLPTLQKMTIEDKIKVLSIKYSEGPIHKYALLRELFQDCDGEELTKVLSLKPSNESSLYDCSEMRTLLFSTLLLNKVVCRKLVRLLKKMPIEKVVQVLSTMTFLKEPIFVSEVCEILLPLWEQMETFDLFKVFSITDSKGCTPLDYAAIVHSLSPLFAKKSINNLLSLLSLQRKPNSSCDSEIIKMLLPVLLHLERDAFVTVISKLVLHGVMLLHSAATVRALKDKIDVIYDTDFVKLFTAKNQQGKTPMHDPEIVQALLKSIDYRGMSLQNELFSSQDNNGDTPLHNESIFKAVSGLLISHKIYLIKNKEGITPFKKNER